MLVSTPTKDYVALRNPTNMSPSCRPRYCTPQRIMKDAAPAYDSPLLTPSPLRQRPLFPRHLSDTAFSTLDGDDLFSQSPYKTPAPAHNHHPSYPTKPQPISADDDEGSIFLASSNPNAFMPVSSSQPLRTPVKQAHRIPSRPALSIKHLNTVSATPVSPAAGATCVGVGTKRKSSSQNVSTPLRPHTLIPHKVAASKTVDPRALACFMFDKLAPLEAPKLARTPQTKAETDAHLRRQTATLTKLKLADLNDPDDNFSLDLVSGLNDNMENFKPDSTFTRLTTASGQKALVDRTKDKAEVAEAVSPGGHIIKRRARSRPVSEELLESAHRPLTSPSKSSSLGTKLPVTRSHGRSSSGSSMEATSPRPRRRTSGTAHPYAARPAHSPLVSRTSLSRIDSGSSASLFFGPSIPSTTTSARVRTTTTPTSATPGPPLRVQHTQCKTLNRHSYSGDNHQAWNTIQARAVSPSPDSSPIRGSYEQQRRQSLEGDEDAFFGVTSHNSSFQLNVMENTPSPRSRRLDPGTLQRKYRPRDSGVIVSDDDDNSFNWSSNGDHPNTMPRASMSVSSLYSDADDGLITPGIVPESDSGWPGTNVFVRDTDDSGVRHSLNGRDNEIDVDAFIMHTLSTASKGAPNGVKRVPGTPVKKVRTTFLGIDRPWQSAVAPKVGLRYDMDERRPKVPRKSLPAAFPDVNRKRGKGLFDQLTDSEGEEDSPIAKRDKYSGLGLGHPQPSLLTEGLPARTRWLMRRSSSGAFSSGSDSASMVGTPTRNKDVDWRMPNPPLKNSPVRATSGSSTSSTTTFPSITRRSRPFPITGPKRPAPRSASLVRRAINAPDEEQPGRFERDFVEIDEVGSGEFGKVIKVQSKNKVDHEIYAIKKSKRFEGPRHRLRLREEVDILKHLSQYAQSIGIQGRHVNVLAYIDSWEEDEALYIQTELCESGNLARFLWEYGCVFPRLDEARVWKIIVDLSNGLRFIHEAGVIHLDIKPSNIFLTKEGRFKIGDFGMASPWPRKPDLGLVNSSGFEREGDKLYLAPEVLQGQYGKAADVFSFGMTILEIAANIVVPDQGEAWHRLRQEDFSQVDLDDSPELLGLIRQLMRTDPSQRVSAQAVFDHPTVSRARIIMERTYDLAMKNGTSVFAASPLASVPDGFLAEILDRPIELDFGSMDTSP
ncbi:hypothetical protein AX17_004522 [Amanita inopinata Kibby_2008]|nr:hypothetical protein AX17_004522 [Amanita inopinata Kibby_2008]